MVKKNQKSKIKNQNCGIRQWRMIFLFFIFLIGGCGGQKRNCPPLKTTKEVSAVLKGYSAGIKPLKASGNCKISYTNEKGETFAQGFPVRIWYLNNQKYCLYGDVMFDAKGMSFAVTGGEYWIYAKQFGVYTTGKIDETGDDYLYGPAVFLDFLQPFSVRCKKVYTAEAEDEFDILMCRDDKICGTKKIYMDRCNRKVRKIEYLNCPGNLILAVEADEYKKVTGVKGLSFPRKLSYKYFKGGQCTDQRQIKLDSVKLWEAEPNQVKALFTPPDVNSSASGG
jgi:hypothetical protein